ncbi:pimeloyl-ACP methyl ester carboxylesterase [Kribbella aluminosa]|uniref:Pimeloyl-ACP methyl ester carboxylesterase n=1 Tax=Kribbella aluminosa TaxID=416017 RepID=A0ABS4UYM5_9ACTN|nr:alpha/beta fold hydrolase [Kribbella aluminosa]MBP2356737.1 pimeloyl-ACP methyl ester carboxylesterase [Kribbella aluminosa]
MMIRRFVVAAGVSFALVAGAMTSLPAATAVPVQAKPSSYTPPPIQWGTCASAGLARRGAQCGYVEVPLDYSRPDGTKIQLAVSRIKHKTPDAQAQGPMLVNPGGPGGSGLTLAVLGEFVPNHGGDPYDWIGFDPRGVGSSVPSLHCIADYAGYNRPFYIPVTRQVEHVWIQRSKAYAQACDSAQHALLGHLTTVDSVRDMESIRKALGAPQINYYGFSYGTYLGQVYGTLYPDRLRRAVFDGVVNATRVWYQANLDQDVAFNKSVKVFFAYVAAHDSTWHLGTTEAAVEKQYYKQLLKLAGHPADGKIGPDEWTDIFTQAAYYVYGWVDVAGAFAAWVHDANAAPLVALYGGPPFDDNLLAVYLGVSCTDAKWPTNWNTWRRDNWNYFAKAPFLTWANAWFNAPCAFWPAKAGNPVKVDGSRVKSLLMINETLDAATPYSGALQTRKTFPHSALIEGVGGTTHAGSLSGVACTDDRIAAYLLTGALPARVSGNRSDVQCAPVPAPQPAAALSPAAKAASSLAAERHALTQLDPR